MSRDYDDIRQQMLLFANKNGKAAVYPVVVLSVNKEQNTIEAEFDSELVMDDIRLRAVEKEGSRMIIVPTVGSTVMICAIDGSQEFVVVAVEAFDEVLIEKDGLEISITDKLEIKKGEDTLSAVLSDLITEIAKVVVLYGTSPDVPALTAINSRQKQLLK